jgi:hypothetical protein
VPNIIRRFYATRPPSDALEELNRLLRKLVEAIEANLGRPPSRWEKKALRALCDFAGTSPSPSPSHRGSEVSPTESPPTESTPPRVERRSAETPDPEAPPETLPKSGNARHETLVRWYRDADADGAHNRTDQDAVVTMRAQAAGASLGWKERVDARRAANVPGKPGPKPRS